MELTRQLTRRSFTQAVGLLGLTPRLSSTRRLRILVLGGTNFVGPAIVSAALARGHDVTLFNRGRTNPELFPELNKLRGDREAPGGLAALEDGGEWDAVIDTWPNRRELVADAVSMLADRVAHHLFISSIAVYSDFSKPGMNEDGPTHRPSSEHYGAGKVACELAAAEHFERSTIVRPGAIVGPRKPNDSLRYWVVRIARGGELLAPGTGRDPVQYTDVNDLADFCVHALESKVTGTFNTLGPRTRLTMAELLHGIKAITEGDATFTWVSEAFLREQRVRSWGEMPLWAPLSEDEGFLQLDNSRAFAAGYRHRPLAETARSSLAWFEENFPADYGFGQPEKDGISRARELELLAAWQRR